MNEDLILFDENNGDEESQEIISAPEDNHETLSIIEVRPEEFDISEPFFTGVQIAGVMCMLSLGVAMILKIFRQA